MLNKNVFILNVQYMQNIYESIFDKKKTYLCDVAYHPQLIFSSIVVKNTSHIFT